MVRDERDGTGAEREGGFSFFFIFPFFFERGEGTARTGKNVTPGGIS